MPMVNAVQTCRLYNLLAIKLVYACLLFSCMLQLFHIIITLNKLINYDTLRYI